MFFVSFNLAFDSWMTSFTVWFDSNLQYCLSKKLKLLKNFEFDEIFVEKDGTNQIYYFWILLETLSGRRLLEKWMTCNNGKHKRLGLLANNIVGWTIWFNYYGIVLNFFQIKLFLNYRNGLEQINCWS